MAIQLKLSFLFCLILSLCTGFSLPYENKQDPRREFQQCQESCLKYKDLQEFGDCERSCLKQFQEDSRKQFFQCQGGCAQQHSKDVEQFKRCEVGCMTQYTGVGNAQGVNEADSEGREEVKENPYFFRHEKFHSHITTEEGSIKVLEKFSRKSELLKGIDNYRLTLVQANPNTFMLPVHWDADCVWFVYKGRGAVTLLQQNSKETRNLERGNIIRIHAGTTVNLINSDNNEKLFIVELTIPVNTPGSFESFSGAGTKDLESYFNAFSEEILEAAFNAGGSDLRKLFEVKNKDAFVHVSKEKIQALTGGRSHHGESESSRPHKLLDQQPSQSNKYGKMFEVFPKDSKQLQDLDVGFSFVNITQDGMMGPFYNSKSTKIAIVTNGKAQVEIACPHLSQQQGQQGGEHGSRSRKSTSYQKVSAELSCGDVFVLPAGHPVVVVSKGDENLEVACFQIDAQNNKRYQLAGKDNILKQMESEAKELSFNIAAKQVDEILNKQKETFFFPGPKKGGQQHDGYAWE